MTDALPLDVGRELVIDVVGEPVPQGSMQALNRGGRPVVVPANATELGRWRREIVSVTQARMRREGWTVLDGPIELTVLFLHQRPKTITRKYPTVPPDGDKCFRAIADALKIAGAIVDDARIVDWIGRQRYTTGRPGARITIRSIT